MELILKGVFFGIGIYIALNFFPIVVGVLGVLFFILLLNYFLVEHLFSKRKDILMQMLINRVKAQKKEEKDKSEKAS